MSIDSPISRFEPKPPRGGLLRTSWYNLGRSFIKAYAQSMFTMDVVFQAPLPAGAKILAPNHPTTSDPILLTTLLPEQISILILDTLFKVPVVGASLRYTGHICVDAHDGKPAFAQALCNLAQGCTLGVFPEGEISPAEGVFHRPHTGAARLAIESGAPVVPVGIYVDYTKIKRIETQVEGSAEVGAWYTQGAYSVTFGEPIVFDGCCDDREHVRLVSAEIMERISALERESARRARSKLLAPRRRQFAPHKAISPMRLAGWAAPLALQVLPVLFGYIVRSFAFMGKVI